MQESTTIIPGRINVLCRLLLLPLFLVLHLLLSLLLGLLLGPLGLLLLQAESFENLVLYGVGGPSNDQGVQRGTKVDVQQLLHAARHDLQTTASCRKVRGGPERTIRIQKCSSIFARGSLNGESWQAARRARVALNPSPAALQCRSGGLAAAAARAGPLPAPEAGIKYPAH